MRTRSLAEFFLQILVEESEIARAAVTIALGVITDRTECVRKSISRSAARSIARDRTPIGARSISD
jgi:hypothetical protein